MVQVGIVMVIPLNITKAIQSSKAKIIDIIIFLVLTINSIIIMTLSIFVTVILILIPLQIYSYNHQNKKFLHKLQISIRSIGTTVLKKNIPMILLGTNIKEKERKYYAIRAKNPKIKYRDDKQSIIIMARQHPGQSQGSYVCQGLLKSLLQLQTFESKFMLSNFNFFIFPMINIDGVINGNYRSNVYGYDLNRNWARQKQLKHPEIYYIKRQIEKIQKFSKICLVIDLHGHSKKMNSFFFGNPNLKNPQNPKLLPLLASKLTNHISFQDCTFNNSEDKQGAARVVIQNMLNSQKQCNVYTFESSFYGTYKNSKKIHFSIDDYKNLGGDLFMSIYKKYSQQIKQVKTLMESAVNKQLKKQLSTIIVSQMQKMKIQSGSDSEAQEIYNQDEIIDIEQFIENREEQNFEKMDKKKKLDVLLQELNNKQQQNQNNEMILKNTLCHSNEAQTAFQQLEFQNQFLLQKNQKKILPRNELIKIQIEKRKSSLFNHTMNEFRVQPSEKLSNIPFINKLKVLGQKCSQKSYIKSKATKSTQTQTSFLFELQKIYGNTNGFKYHTINHRNQKKYHSYETGKRSATVRNFDKDLITQQVSEMIKVRKIQYKNKLSVGTFKQQFPLLIDESEQKNRLPYV